MKKKANVFLALLLTMMLLCGCGASSFSVTETAVNAAAPSAAPAEPAAGEIAEWDSAEWGEVQSSAGTDTGGADSRLSSAKLIYTASICAETTDFDGCAADLETLVAQLSGYFESASVSNYGSGYRSASYKVRVPAEQFQPFCRKVGTFCHITYRDTSAENISEAYYDTESRLVTQQTKLERLQTLLRQAESMEDIITIESAISETELAIERLSGTLRQYDALVDYATVYVDLSEVYRLSNTEEPADSFTSRMGTAFASGWDGFVSALESFAIALAYGWMWLVVLAALFAGGVLLAKRSAARRRARLSQSAPQQKPEEKPDRPE